MAGVSRSSMDRSVQERHGKPRRGQVKLGTVGSDKARQARQAEDRRGGVWCVGAGYGTDWQTSWGEVSSVLARLTPAW